MALIAQSRHLYLLQDIAQVSKLGQQREMLVTISAPCNFLLHRDLSYAVISSKLVAGMKDGSSAQVRYSHFAFDHRNPRSLDSTIHRENSSGDGDAAISRRNIEVSGMPLGGLDNDIA